MNTKTTPVLLLAGYLGSGKTTLLNRILRNEDGVRFAVIVNDIGEINIDAQLIQQGGIVDQGDDSLVALQNGCICCTLRMDLVKQLEDLLSADRFDYIVIEASGICDPAPIAQTIDSIPSLSPQEWHLDRYPQLDCICTIVDALRLKDDFKGGLDLLGDRTPQEEDVENLVIQQIEFCNMVLLNKASEVTAEQLSSTTEVLKALQPNAEIIPCDYGQVPLHKLLHTHLFDFERTATSATWVQKIEGHDEEEDHDHEEHEHHHDHEHEHDEHHHHHDHPEGCTCEECQHDHEHGGHHHHHVHVHVSTYVYRSRKPFSLSRFDHFVARRWPKGIIRTKGICYFKGEEQYCYLFEQAGKQVSLKNAGQWYATMPEDELEKLMARYPQVRDDWDPEVGDRQQKLVFIGRDLAPDLIQSELDLCLDQS